MNQKPLRDLDTLLTDSGFAKKENDVQTIDLPDHIEDVIESPTSPDNVLTDDALAAGGLVKVNAFMRTKSSAGALRVQKHRDKMEAEGVKQINVQASEEARQAIKTIAARTGEGEKLENVLAELVPDRLTTEEKQTIAIGKQVKALTGWRKKLIRALGINI